MGRFRRNKGAHLRHDGNECILAQEGGFASHIGAGDEPDGVAAFVSRQMAIIGDKGAATAVGESLLDNQMAGLLHGKGTRGIDLGAGEICGFGKLAQSGGHICLGKG